MSLRKNKLNYFNHKTEFAFLRYSILFALNENVEQRFNVLKISLSSEISVSEISEARNDSSALSVVFWVEGSSDDFYFREGVAYRLSTTVSHKQRY